MQTISATYRVTTPMFLGGAEQQAELRLPSFKGMLRFWWRAMAWDRIRDASQLRDEEASLFGSSDERFGQSMVLMRLDRNTAVPPALSPPEQLKGETQVVGSGARYLGYGVMEAFASKPRNTKEGQLTRSCSLAPFSFTVNLMLKRSLKPEERQEIEATLKMLGLVGGLGSKSRKGYGSLTLLSLKVDAKETWTPPAKAEQVADSIRSVLGPNRLSSSQSTKQSHDVLPEWTAFSPATRVVVLSAANHDRTPLALLDRIGREMVRYRSWGRNGKVLGNVDSEQNFRDDHDLMKQSWKQRKKHPLRIVFGLPHNYGKPPTEHVEPAENYDRRASPLFVHIHQTSETIQPVAVLSFLPARFLPADAGGISVGRQDVPGVQQRQTVELASEDLWTPINAFLVRLLDQDHRMEPFGKVTEVAHG